MQDRLNLTVYADDSRLMFAPESFTANYEVVYHFPPVILPLNIDNVTLGEKIIACAKLCKGRVDEPSTYADDMAKTFGFKSDKEMTKRTIMVCVTRRDGADKFHILPTKRVRRQVLWADGDVWTPINDAQAIGEAIRNTLSLSR